MLTTAKEIGAQPLYEIREVSDITGISIYTLRYYDKCGFFPELYKDKNGRRKFSDADIDQLHLIEALRKSGLSIDGLKYFVKLSMDGSKTAEVRAILEKQAVTLEYQRDEIEVGLETIQRARKVLDSACGETKADKTFDFGE